MKLRIFTGCFLLATAIVAGCGNKIDGSLVIQPIWPCELDPAVVDSEVGNWCLSVIRSDGTEGEKSCASSLEGISLTADEKSGQVRLKLEAWDKFNIMYARGVSVPLRLESGKDNSLPIAMSLIGRFSLIAGDVTGCSRLPFHMGVSQALGLPSGHLLAAGCADPDNGDDTGRCALLIDPSNYRLVTLATPPSARRFGHQMVALKDGRVLVAGGLDMSNNPLDSLLMLRGGDIFLQPYQTGLDYSLVRFEQLALGLKSARQFPTVASVFFGNQVLINDGSGNTPEMWLGTSESSDYISLSGTDPFPYDGTLKYAQAVASIDESRAVVLGGVADHQGLLAVAQNSRQVSFTSFNIPLEARNAPKTVVLDGGDVMFIGGKTNTSSSLSPVLVLNVNSRQLTEVPATAGVFPQGGFTATLLADGRVLVAGGFSGTTGFKPGSSFLISRTNDPLNPWKMETGPDLKMPRLFHSSALLPDGRLILIGGGSSDTAVEHKRVMLSAEVVTF